MGGSTEITMRITSLETSLMNSGCSSNCEVEIKCECSFDELKHFYNVCNKKYSTELYITTEKPVVESKHTVKKGKFGGLVTLQDGKQVYIKKVIYSNPVTIVIWSDDVKTRCTCHKDDKYNGEFGLTLCILKRFMSTDQLNLLYEDWFVEEVNDMDFFDITLKDLRERDKLIKKGYND